MALKNLQNYGGRLELLQKQRFSLLQAFLRPFLYRLQPYTRVDCKIYAKCERLFTRQTVYLIPCALTHLEKSVNISGQLWVGK